MNNLSTTISVTIACDHTGIELKKRVISYLHKKNITVHDQGVHTDASVDYPDIAHLAISFFRKELDQFLILICGTGIGMDIVANKYQGIRCALVQNSYTATMARQHNHANCLALSARVPYQEPIEEILDHFFNSVPEDGRHENRVQKIAEIEKKNYSL